MSKSKLDKGIWYIHPFFKYLSKSVKQPKETSILLNTYSKHLFNFKRKARELKRVAVDFLPK